MLVAFDFASLFFFFFFLAFKTAFTMEGPVWGRGLCGGELSHMSTLRRKREGAENDAKTCKCCMFLDFSQEARKRENKTP